ncbi:hypothetical protein ACQYAD_06370 [Neobacillus sp. SM06]|uniref:hypothetical protein n=1 Tax=Neobacillus sp. SM06 TaxID=3422492 RepID=UPI003D2C6DA8
MKMYVIIILQFMIWSGYTLIEWLSSRDQLVYKVLMFFVFFYLAFLLGRKLTESTAKAFFVTTLSLTMYTSFHFTMVYFTG